MSVFARTHLPSLGGATGWLNSEPLGPAELRGHIPFRLRLDEDGNGLLCDGCLYRLVRPHDTVRERTLEITFLEPGAEAYSFTFG